MALSCMDACWSAVLMICGSVAEVEGTLAGTTG
jgi:hypothetical protein